MCLYLNNSLDTIIELNPFVSSWSLLSLKLILGKYIYEKSSFGCVHLMSVNWLVLLNFVLPLILV